MKFYYFHTLKALWDGQSKIKMHYEMSRVKKLLSGKRSIMRTFIWKLKLKLYRHNLAKHCASKSFRAAYLSEGTLISWFLKGI